MACGCRWTDPLRIDGVDQVGTIARMSHTPEPSLAPLWRRLEALCTQCNPALPSGGLLSGLSEAQLQAAEVVLGFPLPPDLRSAYGHFNGMDQRHFRLFPEGQQWLPLVRTDAWVSTATTALESFRVNEELRPGFWDDLGETEEDACAESESQGAEFHWAMLHAGRVPVTNPGTDTALLIDTAPPSNGRYGQLIFADATDGCQLVMRDGFAAAVGAIISAFEAGRIHFDKPQNQWVETESGDALQLDGLSGLA